MKIQVLFAALISISASAALEAAIVDSYVSSDVMIPMRDGIKLHARVLRPRGATGKLPMLMQRSPYGFGVERVKQSFEGELKDLAEEGFIFVLQDIRGRFESEGQFVMLRPRASRQVPIDESTDTYDSIEWLVKSVPDNNGRVGLFGISYGGWTTAMGLIGPHPGLKAVSVQASPDDQFIGDDFHHNGAFRLSYAWEYCAALENDGRTLQRFEFKDDDTYSWYLRQGPLASLDQKSLGRTLPTWQNFVAHPSYDAYWKAQVTSSQLPSQVRVPNLIVAGWWDQEDFYGPVTIYERQEKGDTQNRNFIVIGPWNHGGWAGGDGTRYGPYDLNSPTSSYFRSQVEVPWFKYWLKGEGALGQPEALVFETGSNQWHSYEAWPPRKGIAKRKLFLREERSLSFEPPQASESADEFVSDPANPVPYRRRPIAPMWVEGSTWPLWLADDQRPLAERPDVVVWQTPPLEKDIVVRGDISAQLFASTTGTDADWIVKVVDVFPDDNSVAEPLRNRHLMIANDVFRGRFRSSFEHPQAIAAGKVLLYSIDLHSASHVFKKGHRIAVHVQSTWFPLIDRNPQTFIPNIFEAGPSDFKAQTHAVFHNRQYPSAIILDVAD
jgi:putative CocE/NonD family hydrolase